MTRTVLALLALGTMLLLAACGGDPAPPATTAAAPAPKRLRIIFPEGLNVREMGDRVAAVRGIAVAKRGVTPKLTRARYLAAERDRGRRRPSCRDWQRGMEGFLFPALYEFTQFSMATSPPTTSSPLSGGRSRA